MDAGVRIGKKMTTTYDVPRPERLTLEATGGLVISGAAIRATIRTTQEPAIIDLDRTQSFQVSWSAKSWSMTIEGTGPVIVRRICDYCGSAGLSPLAKACLNCGAP
jgi:hypothetical protein